MREGKRKKTLVDNLNIEYMARLYFANRHLFFIFRDLGIEISLEPKVRTHSLVLMSMK
jgi:hypothetical protein